MFTPSYSTALRPPRSYYRIVASILASINLLSSYPSKPFHSITRITSTSRARITPTCPALS